MEKGVPIDHVEAILGRSAQLPCDILPRDSHDDVYLVLWFKDDNTKPMYSLDVRGKPLSQASYWSDSSSLGQRSSFKSNIYPNSLIIEKINLGDSGIYKCRVDYRNSPTKNVKLNLSIIVPPEEPVIRDGDGNQILGYEVGPHEIGDDLILDCEVHGGVPAPRVTWWKGGTIYDSSDETIRPGVYVNRMIYKDLSRQDLNTQYVCQASNTNRTLPVSRTIKVSLNLKPVSVKILAKPTFISAEKEIEVICQALGGYPPPTLTWWLGSKSLDAYDEENYSGVAKTRLRFIPNISDDGRYLTCRAENPALMNTAIEDQWAIKVHYAPRVSLRLGQNLNAENIRTNHDVYFECDVQANPTPLRLEWLHNGEILKQNSDAGIIMSTRSLVLQQVDRSAVGDYTCRAINSEGTGESNKVPLKIMYSPVCQSEMVDQLIGVTAEESISINCRVDAYPPLVAFTWFFNNSDHHEELEQDRFSSDGLISTLNFTPTNNQDYGTLFCQGENTIGHQIEPCTFQIVPTGRPAPLSECKVINQSLPIVKIGCREGFDGGLPQTFMLELYEKKGNKIPDDGSKTENEASGSEELRDMILKTQVTNQFPQFELTNIDSGIPVKLFVYAQNSKGSSEPFIIQETFVKQRKHAVEGVTDSKAVTGKDSKKDTSTTSGLVIITTGILTGALLTILVVSLIFSCRKRRLSGSSSSSSSSSSMSTIGKPGNNHPSPTTLTSIAASAKKTSGSALCSNPEARQLLLRPVDTNNPDIIHSASTTSTGYYDVLGSLPSANSFNSNLSSSASLIRRPGSMDENNEIRKTGSSRRTSIQGLNTHELNDGGHSLKDWNGPHGNAGGTLGRRRDSSLHRNPNYYPSSYHTCDRRADPSFHHHHHHHHPGSSSGSNTASAQVQTQTLPHITPSNTKKKVTIVEDNNTESSV
nr:hemicentin-1-like [Lepeophtheirus salmonis]